MNSKYIVIFIFSFFASTFTAYGIAKDIAGWIEPVNIQPYEMKVNAKLDSGARNSSLNARDLKIVFVKGIEHVEFSVVDDTGKTQHIKSPIYRTVSIKRHSGKNQERPAILMDICLGNKLKKVEVNLIDRTGFDYQLLLGRSFLAPDTLIDSSQKMLTKPDCKSLK